MLSSWIELTYSKDSTQDLDDRLLRISLIPVHILSDIVEQRAKEGRLKQLVESNELERSLTPRTKIIGKRPAGKLSTSLERNLPELRITGSREAVVVGDHVRSLVHNPGIAATDEGRRGEE